MGKNVEETKNISLEQDDQSFPGSQRIGEWKFPHKQFVYQKSIVLKHTNVEGNTYFDNFVSWQGEARELLLVSHPDIATFLKNMKSVKMITHSLHHVFKGEAFFGDLIRIVVTTRNIKFCSFIMMFRFYNHLNNKFLGEGWQKICFAEGQSQRLCRIPRVILDLIEPIKEN